jgi:hypothetical protein
MTPTVMALPKDGWRAVAPRMALAFQYEPMFVAGFPDSHRRLEKTEAFMRWLYRDEAPQVSCRIFLSWKDARPCRSRSIRS